MIMDASKYVKYSAAIIITLLFGYIFFEYLIPLSMPFVIAFLISRLVRPVSKAMRRISPYLDKPVTVLALLLLTAAICILVRLAAVSAVSQINDLLNVLSERLAPVSTVTEKLIAFAESHPVLKKYILSGVDPGNIENAVAGFLRNALSEAGSFFAKATGSFIAGFPSAILTFFITVSAAFYFSLDRGETGGFISAFLPKDKAAFLIEKKKTVSKAVVGYFKTYFLMMLIVFAVMYIGLTFIGVDHSFLKAMLIAVIDLLPVLGVGTVIVPWSIICFITGNVSRGVALLILFAVVTVVRELAEPKIVGKYIGAPPIFALMSVYVGTKLFGVPGLILFPIITSVAFAVIKETGKQKPRPESG